MTGTTAVGVVVPAAGRGARYASGRGAAAERAPAENKIWTPLLGRPALYWTLRAFQQHPRVTAIAVVGAPGELDRIRELCGEFGRVRAVVAGGATRAESVHRGLTALPPECEVALVHDAARPAVCTALITRVIEKTVECCAAVPGLPVSDTVKRTDDGGRIRETVPRDGLWTVQTPQGARLADLLTAYDRLGPRAAECTDEAGILDAAGYAVHMVAGDPQNVKITVAGDEQRAAAAIAAMGYAAAEPAARPSRLVAGGADADDTVRTGFGYDVHAFAEGRDLWLGGVRVPHARGLAGHSDADVLLHAVCDALLGAAGMGDIGVLFPDTDAAHKDRPSIQFVREVANRLAAADWRISNIDVALLAEEPRIGPFRDAMTAAIAAGLDIAPTRINIKATTSERMGFVGRREGIACWAVATIARNSNGS